MLTGREALVWPPRTTCKQILSTEAMQNFLNWLKSKFSPNKDTPRRKLRKAGSNPGQSATQSRGIAAEHKQAIRRRQPKHVDDDNGPGKNVLIGNKDVGEDTGETLELVDDLSNESDDGLGVDPYNTGQFDTSKNWDKQFRK